MYVACAIVRIRGLPTSSEQNTAGPAQPSREEIDAQLERERRGARLAALVSIVAGVLIPAGLIWLIVASADAPSGNAPALLRFFDGHATVFVITRAVSGFGLVLLAPVAYYLWRATQFRRPEAPRVTAITGIAGPVLAGIATVVAAVILAVGAGDYVQRDYQTIKAAQDVFDTAGRGVAAVVLVAGTLATGFWLVLGSLHAMRVGLLTRQMGIIGIALGPLFVLSGSGLPPIQMLLGLWLIALGVLFAGYWPGGRPKAWQSGTAVPWPSASDRRAELLRKRAEAKPS